MTTLYLGLAGTLFFLILTFISFLNKRLNSFSSFWKYPLFVLPLIVFTWILSTQLYIPLKGNGCTYALSQDLIEPEQFSVNKKSGILMFFMDGFGNCEVSVSMNNGKTYTGKSLNNVFAIVLPSDSGRVKSILAGEKGDTISGDMKFSIQPGKLTYVGTLETPKGLAMLIPGMAGKAADLTFKAPTNAHLSLLKNWAKNHRIQLSLPLKNSLTELQKNYKTASQFVGIQFGYLPFTTTSAKGTKQSKTPEEITKEYETYQFLLK